jgi:hypothetical protein
MIKIRNLRLLPYGVYLTATDAVYFDRDYRPIVRLTYPSEINWPNATAIGEPVVTVCDPAERITFDRKEFFYNDGNPPSRNKQTRQRLEQRVRSNPEMGREIERRSKSKGAA